MRTGELHPFLLQDVAGFPFDEPKTIGRIFLQGKLGAFFAHGFTMNQTESGPNPTVIRSKRISHRSFYSRPLMVEVVT